VRQQTAERFNDLLATSHAEEPVMYDGGAHLVLSQLRKSLKRRSVRSVPL
jgi:hypothetical protein